MHTEKLQYAEDWQRKVPSAAHFAHHAPGSMHTTSECSLNSWKTLRVYTVPFDVPSLDVDDEAHRLYVQLLSMKVESDLMPILEASAWLSLTTVVLAVAVSL